MTSSELIASLFSTIILAAGLTWGICAWFLDKKLENDKQIEELKKANQDQTTKEIKTLIFEMKQKMTELEMLQTNMSAATMKQFHALELSMKDYSKDIQIQAEQIKWQRDEIQKVWQTFTEEIAPGVFRVSDKKK
jgi:hypothetical protein